MLVRSRMTSHVHTATPDTPVEDAAKLLYTHRIGFLPVLEDGRLVGILTERDLLRAFPELFGARSPSRRLEARMRNRPGDLARVVRLIGIEKKINIAGIRTGSHESRLCAHAAVFTSTQRSL